MPTDWRKHLRERQAELDRHASVVVKPAHLMVRLGAVDRESNVAVIHVACQDHAHMVVTKSGPRYRFHLSPIGSTDRTCHYCERGAPRGELGA